MPPVRLERRGRAGERADLAARSARQPGRPEPPQSRRNRARDLRRAAADRPQSADRGVRGCGFCPEARDERSATFLAHIRFASTGAKTVENTHPFEQDGRLFAHNGVLAGLEQIEAELGADTALLQGQTDSERLFALITHEIRGNGGDVRAGIVSAVGWIAANVPLYSLNLILTTPTEVFALRYPDTNTLYLLERAAGGGDGGGGLHHHSSLGTCVRSEEAAQRPVVVIASERMDDDPGWRAISPGELVHVDEQLAVHSEIAFPEPPTHMIDLHRLDEHARSSQGW